MKITKEALVKLATFGGKVRFNENMRDMYIPAPRKSIVKPSSSLRRLTDPSAGRFTNDILGGLTSAEVKKGNKDWSKKLRGLV